MGVSLKTCSVDKAEDAIQLPRIVNVFREYVFVQRVPSRAVDEEQCSLTHLTRQFAEKPPPIPSDFEILGRILELLARPENRPLGTAAKSLGIEQRTLIVISQHAHIKAHDSIHALARIGPVPHNVS